MVSPYTAVVINTHGRDRLGIHSSQIEPTTC